MEITIASNAGFCFGVRRAIKTALDTHGSRVFCLGDIIHNRQAVKDLERKGIRVIESIDQLREGDSIIIRSHGEPPEVFLKLEKKGVKIVDATCPYVRAAQKHGKRLREEGYEVIIIGTRGHPEVIGLAAHSGTDKIISNPDEIKGPFHYEKVGAIAQTTVSREVFLGIKDKIKRVHPDAVIIDTICKATEEREKEAARLAKNSDIMVVVGGKHSSNTAKLTLVCKKIARTYLVEEANDLDPSWFETAEKVGIAAGASTPEKSIHEIVNRISSFDKD